MITPQFKNPTTGNFEPSPRLILPNSAVKSAVDAYLAEHQIAPTTGIDLNKESSPIKYRVGIISDIHCSKSASGESALDFRNALSIFSDYGCDFVCSSGDIPTSSSMSDKEGTALPQAMTYKSIREASAYSDKFYACRGNHDWVYSDSELESINGSPCNNFFKIGDDAFVFLSYSIPSSYTDNSMFPSTGTDALNSVLDYWHSIQSNLADCKRIFVFNHFPLYNWAGYGANKIYGWGTSQTNTLLAELKKNNVIYFCGHSHIKFQDEERFDYIKFKQDTETNFATVSVPSLSNARILKDDGTLEWDNGTDTTFGQAYIMDVCDSCIILHGIDVEEAVTLDTIDLGDKYTYVVNKLDKNACRQDIYSGIIAVDKAFENIVIADSATAELDNGTHYFEKSDYDSFHGNWDTYKSYVNNAFTSLSDYTSAMKSIGIGLFDKTRTDMKTYATQGAELTVADFSNGTTWHSTQGANVIINGDEIDITIDTPAKGALVAVTGLALEANKQYRLIADEYVLSGESNKEPYVNCYFSTDDSTTPRSYSTNGNIAITNITNAINASTSSSVGSITISEGTNGVNRGNNFTIGFNFTPSDVAKMAWLTIRTSSSAVITSPVTFHFKNLRIVEV